MIDKVGYTKPTSATRTGNVRRTGEASGSAFADALSKAEGASGTEAAAATSATAAMTGMSGLIGINEVDEREHQRRKQVKRGRMTLEALEKVRDGLLIGRLPYSTLRSLERLIAEERALTTDPVLNGILDEIEVRAAVELAKLEMSGLLTPVSNT
jgi:hypothetical protein